MTDKWTKYTISAPFKVAPGDPRSVSSSVSLISQGTAWFDLMEVVPDMDYTVERDGSRFKVAMNCHIDGGVIYFTTNGENPTEMSTKYTDTLLIDNVVTLKARLFKDGVRYGVTEQAVAAHKGLGAKVKYLQPYTQYTAGGDGALTDGRMAELRQLAPGWQGFINNDMEVVLDLGKSMSVNKISSLYFHSPMELIVPPTSVEYSISDDGINFTSLGIKELGQAKKEQNRRVVVGQEVGGKTMRYIKVKAVGHHKMPSWHIGGDAWVFCDEVIVE